MSQVGLAVIGGVGFDPDVGVVGALRVGGLVKDEHPELGARHQVVQGGPVIIKPAGLKGKGYVLLLTKSGADDHICARRRVTGG